MTADLQSLLTPEILQVFNASLDPLGIVDGAGRYVWVNDAGVRFFQYSREEIIGSHFRQHLAEAEEPGRAMTQAQQGDPSVTVRRVRRRDGEVAVVRTELLPIGQTGYVLIHGTDLTTLYATLDRITESEGVLARAQEIGGTGSWVTRFPERVTRWFGPKGHLLGMPMGAEVPGTLILEDRVLPEDRPIVSRIVERAYAQDSAVDVFRGIGPAGEVRWLRMYAVAQRDPKTGEVQRVEGVIHDITDVREQDLRYRQLLEAVRVPMLIWTPQDGETPARIWYVNDALCTLLGLLATDLLGRPPSILTRDDELEMLRRLVQGVFDGGEMQPTPVHVRRADGTHADCLFIASRVRYEGMDALCGQVIDISEGVRLREVVARARETDIAFAVAAGVAHDFNNLLTGVIGYLDFAGEELDPDSAAGRYVLAAGQAAHRAANLAKALLGYSRSGAAEEEGRILPTVVTDAKDVLREAYAITRAAITRSVAMTTHEGTEEAHVEIAPDTLLRVLVNLVVNARDAVLERVESAAPGYRPTIDLGVRALPEERLVEAWVTDNGVGIPAAIAPRIFDPFFTTKGGHGGSGLGLPGARDLSRAAGGDLSFTSEEGVGTTFTLRLPLTDAPTSPAF